MPPIMSYTTTVQAEKTVNEIQRLLAAHNVSGVAIQYEGGVPTGLAFTIRTEFGDRQFRLPARIAGLEAALQRQSKGAVPRSRGGWLHVSRPFASPGTSCSNGSRCNSRSSRPAWSPSMRRCFTG